MSDKFEKNSELSSNATVVMNADEIDEKLRIMREKVINDSKPVEDNFVIAPDDLDFTVIEENPEPNYAPELEEQILQADDEDADEMFYDESEKAVHKKKVRKLVVFAVIAAALIGILIAVIIAKNAHNNAEYIGNYRNAQINYNEGNYDKALESLRQALSIKKTDECLILMSECYEAKDDYVNALAILESSTSGDEKIRQRIKELKKAQKAYENGKVIVLNGDEYPVDITSLDLSDKGMRSRQLSRVSMLTELTSLKLSKNRIDSIDFLKNLNKLVSLDLSENKIENIEALSGLSSLKTLHLDGNDVKSFEPLYHLTNLTTLTISDMKISKSQLNDLKQALPNCIITSDDAENDVVEIKLGGKTFNSDVRELDLSGRNISDISALSDCTELETLNLSGNSISDISTLMDLPKLRSVNLSNNKLSDIGPLMTITTIEYLDLSGNSISSIAALGELTALDELSLKGNKIGDFSPLSRLLLLEKLDLTNCGMTDNSVPCLYKLKDLSKLSLEKNNISLRAYNKLKAEFPNCNISHSDFPKVTLGKKTFAAETVNVDASGLGLRDISAVRGLGCVERMDLSNNSISDVSPLMELDTLRELNLAGNNISPDQRSALTNALPNCRINFG